MAKSVNEVLLESKYTLTFPIGVCKHCLVLPSEYLRIQVIKFCCDKEVATSYALYIFIFLGNDDIYN